MRFAWLVGVMIILWACGDLYIKWQSVHDIKLHNEKMAIMQEMHYEKVSISNDKLNESILNYYIK